MGTGKKLSVTLVVVLLSLLVAGSSSAIDVYKKKGAFCMKYGTIRGGPAEYESKDSTASRGELDTSDSYSIGVSFEQVTYRKLWAFLTIDIHDIKYRYLHFAESSKSMLCIGGGLKWNHRAHNSHFGFRPAFSVGYGILPDYGFLKASNYVTFVVGGELVLYTNNGPGFLMEISWIRSLRGGNREYDVKAGPLLILRFGLLL